MGELQFKVIMKGGDASPAVNSPMNQFRKKLGVHSPRMRNSSSKKATPLGRQAAKNAHSRSKSPAPPPGQSGATDKNSNKVSPIKPQTLEFGGAMTSESSSQYSVQDPDLHKDI